MTQLKKKIVKQIKSRLSDTISAIPAGKHLSGTFPTIQNVLKQGENLSPLAFNLP